MKYLFIFSAFILCVSCFIFGLQTQKIKDYKYYKNYELYQKNKPNESCILQLIYTNSIKKETKTYCLQNTDGKNKIIPSNKHDIDIMSCILGYTPCKYEEEKNEEKSKN